MGDRDCEGDCLSEQPVAAIDTLLILIPQYVLVGRINTL